MTGVGHLEKFTHVKIHLDNNHSLGQYALFKCGFSYSGTSDIVGVYGVRLFWGEQMSCIDLSIKQSDIKKIHINLFPHDFILCI